MRVKKQKRHRKVVRFYSACFGFREPYKIFCDGTFIHHLIDHSLTPADDTLSHLLGGRVLLFTTSCVVAELRSLGSSHAEALAAAQELVTARCEHEKRVAAPKCIEDVVGEGNAEHFFVATQDADLRKKFREVPGVPLIYGLKNSLFIEQPSKHQREYVASAEEKRLHMSNSEYPRLHKRGQDSSENNMIDLPSDHDGSENVVMKTQATQNTYAARRKFGVADKSKFKRKIAKGPNPLSCKKKKKRETSSSAQKEGEAGSSTKRKRVRKRKRTHQAGILYSREESSAELSHNSITSILCPREEGHKEEISAELSHNGIPSILCPREEGHKEEISAELSHNGIPSILCPREESSAELHRCDLSVAKIKITTQQIT